MKMKKKERSMLMAIALAGSAAYFIRTFPFGDTIIGGMIGAAFGHPIAGAVTGMLVPTMKTGGIAILADIDPLMGLGGLLPDGQIPEAPDTSTAPNGTKTAG
jgi:hypothetical protein